MPTNILEDKEKAVNATLEDDELNRFWELVKLSEDLKEATDKSIDQVAELAYMKLDIDFDEYGFKSQIDDLDDEVLNVIEDVKSKYGGESHDVEKLKIEVKRNRELRLHLFNIQKAKKLIDEIKTDFDIDSENLEFVSKIAELVSNILKMRARNDIVPLIHRGLYSEDIKSALSFWKSNAESNDGKIEATWQNEFTKRRGILERVLGGRVSFLQSQAHVGGEGLDGRGDKVTDFAFRHSDTHNITLVEIKTPHTTLLGKKYRDTYALSHELSGTIAQVLTQRVEIIKHFFGKQYVSPIKFEVNAPKCFIIVGNLRKELGNDVQKLNAFELHRQAVSAAVTIITFDELYDLFAKFNVVV